jgi:Putative zinc-finger
MDHNQAVQSQACEKYLLGELSPELRDAYEEHYFSCSECAVQLRSAAEFFAASRQVLAEAPVPARDLGRLPRGWFAWLRPAFLAPAFVALLMLIGYQNLVTIPAYKQAASPRVLPMYSLIAANTRGDEGLVFSVSRNQPIGLYVDVPADSAYSGYVLRLETPSGSSTPLRSLTSDEAQKTQVVTVNPGSQAGKYTIVVSGLTNASAEVSSAKELARLQFTIELKN